MPQRKPPAASRCSLLNAVRQQKRVLPPDGVSISGFRVLIVGLIVGLFTFSYCSPLCDSMAFCNHQGKIMRASIRAKIVKVCEARIASKGDDVGVSFYAFFANKNDDPELLMEVAQWWIMEMKLDHFEKARKIIYLVGHTSNQ